MHAAISDTQVLTLIPACQRGDTGAMEGLYDLYADRIYHYVLARTGDVSAAEDLTADVFLRVIQHVHRFKLDTDAAVSFGQRLALSDRCKPGRGLSPGKAAPADRQH